MKRSTQRSIHLQILLFSARAVYTTFSDKKMELMVFGIGQILEIKLITERRVVQLMLELDGPNTEHYFYSDWSVMLRVRWYAYFALQVVTTYLLRFGTYMLHHIVLQELFFTDI